MSVADLIPARRLPTLTVTIFMRMAEASRDTATWRSNQSFTVSLARQPVAVCQPIGTPLLSRYLGEKPSLSRKVPTNCEEVEGGLRSFLAGDQHIRAKQKDDLI